jgi:hypothetical protein
MHMWQCSSLTPFFQKHLPRCHCPQPVVRSFPVCRGALHGFLDFLRRERWIPVPPKRVPRLRAADRLLLEFDQHLDRVQGLAVVTRRARRRYAREWLEWQFGRRRLLWSNLKPRDLFRFVTARAEHLKGTSVHALAVGLRSFLRFLEFTGRIRLGLAAAVPCPASPAFPPPARVLDAGWRLRFLRSFDRHTSAGRRDYVIALCFSELALGAAVGSGAAVSQVSDRGGSQNRDAAPSPLWSGQTAVSPLHLQCPANRATPQGCPPTAGPTSTSDLSDLNRFVGVHRTAHL